MGLSDGFLVLFYFWIGGGLVGNLVVVFFNSFYYIEGDFLFM